MSVVVLAATAVFTVVPCLVIALRLADHCTVEFFKWDRKHDGGKSKADASKCLALCCQVSCAVLPFQ